MAGVLVGASITGLASCALVPTTGSCLDYIALDTPKARLDAATLVVVADVSPTDRTVESTGRYEIHRAEISSVLKGTMTADAIDVINPSDQCTTSYRPVEYLEGDELAEPGTHVLYLRKIDGGSGVWQLVVPNALDPASVATSLPHPK